MAETAPVLQPVRWTERMRPPSRRAVPRAWRGAAYALAALVAAGAIASATAWQLTSRTTAERLLGRVANPLFEVEASVAAALPGLPGRPAGAPLEGYPISISIPAELHGADAEAVAAHVLARTAERLYAEGFEIVAQGEQPRIGLLSDAAAFSSTIGRLSAGGHAVAAVALGAAMTAWGLMVLALLGTSGRRAFIDALTASCLAGGALALAGALAWRGWAASRGAEAADAYARAVWEVAAESADLLLMNAAIVAGAGAVLLIGRLASAWFVSRAAARPAA